MRMKMSVYRKSLFAGLAATPAVLVAVWPLSLGTFAVEMLLLMKGLPAILGIAVSGVSVVLSCALAAFGLRAVMHVERPVDKKDIVRFVKRAAAMIGAYFFPFVLLWGVLLLSAGPIDGKIEGLEALKEALKQASPTIFMIGSTVAIVLCFIWTAKMAFLLPDAVAEKPKSAGRAMEMTNGKKGEIFGLAVQIAIIMCLIVYGAKLAADGLPVLVFLLKPAAYVVNVVFFWATLGILYESLNKQEEGQSSPEATENGGNGEPLPPPPPPPLNF